MPTAPGVDGTLLYDGGCPFCVRSVGLLKRLDRRGRIDCRDARDPANWPAGPHRLDPARLTEEMHLVPADGGPVRHGFGAFRWVARRVPALLPLWPLLFLPGVPWLGQRLYLWVARNRYNLVPCRGGVCTLRAAK